MGNSLFTALPWLVLWWRGVWNLATHYKVSPQWTIGLLLGSAGVVMPLTRSLMPDLMVSSLGLYALSVYLSTDLEDRWSIVGGGIVLGLAMWTKYPAILLLFVPLILERNTRKLAYFVLPPSMCFCWGGVALCPVRSVAFTYRVVRKSWSWCARQSCLWNTDTVGFGCLTDGTDWVRHIHFPCGCYRRRSIPTRLETGILLALGLSALGLVWKGDRWMSVWIGLVLLGVVVGQLRCASLLVGGDGSAGDSRSTAS